MSNGWGTPKYGHGTTNHFSIKPGKNTYRLLPPMKSCAEDGYGWYRYHGIHFGWVGTDPKDPTKTRQKPFRCIQQTDRNRVVTQDCPACDLIAQQKDAFESLKAKLVAAGKREDEIKTEAGPLEDWLRQYNLDFKCYVNAMNPNNEFGDLKINHKFHKKGIDTCIEKLKEQKIDPLDLSQGVWFEISKTSKDGNDSVSVVQEPFSVEGNTYYRPKKAPLDEALANRALEECPDLNDIGFVLTYEQIKAIVESPGEPEDIDRIFGMSQPANVPASFKAGAEVKETPKAEPKQAQPGVNASGPGVSTPTPTPVVAPAAKTLNPNDPAVQKRIAEIRAKKEAEAKAKAEAEKAALEAAKAKPAAVATAVDTDNMSDEDFLAFAAGQST
jgi:hypothetical protein